jgi:hypothetical protein
MLPTHEAAMMPTPDAASGRLPLKGATPAAGLSPFRGVY